MDPVTSLSEFIDVILSRPTSPRITPTYRGHGSIDFILQPSVFRKEVNFKNEHIILRELIAAHPEDFNSDTTALEILVRMQHYSLPTRLLDVSMNPLVALYFACESVRKRVPTVRRGRPTTKSIEMDGHVVVLSASKQRIRYFDSDTVSCLANLARLPWIQKQKLDTSMEREEFNDTTPVKRLLHFIRQEKHGFLGEIEPEHLDEVYLVKPKQNNKRILAQAGAFFAFGLTNEIKDKNVYGIKVEKIKIAGDAKHDILIQLDKLGINEKTLFPEIERAARYITGSLSMDAAISKII